MRHGRSITLRCLLLVTLALLALPFVVGPAAVGASRGIASPPPPPGTDGTAGAETDADTDTAPDTETDQDPASSGRPAAAAPAATLAAVPTWRQADRIAIIPITGPIDRVTLRSLERRIARAKALGCEGIVLELDTPGGEMTATLDITDLLKDRDETPANTVAWVHDSAYSAGAIIALACREIVVDQQAAIGDAAPIQIRVGQLVQMAPAERAKIESPLLAEVRDSARRNHYDENLAQAMVSVTMELWMLEHVDDGRRVIVTRDEFVTAMGREPSGSSAGASSSRAFPGLGRILPQFNQAIAGGPDPSATDADIEYQLQLPPARPPLTEADRGQWQVVPGQVVRDDQLLTLNADEALYYGLATATITDRDAMRDFFAAKEAVVLEPSWSEGLVRILISPTVRIILIIFFVLGFLLEMAAPGTTVFGIIAIASLLILIGAPALVGLAQWFEILMVLVGILLILVEVFLIPGTGIAGFLGLGLLLAGLVGTFIGGDISTPTGRAQLWSGLFSTFIALFGAGVGVWLLSRYFHSSPFLRQMVLETELSQEPTLATAVLGGGGSVQPDHDIQVGDMGVARTTLRPAGRAEFNGVLVDVQSTGGYIEEGHAVVAVRTDSYVIEVETA